MKMACAYTKAENDFNGMDLQIGKSPFLDKA